jgi:single-stranded-DNA-specific exonuclease
VPEALRAYKTEPYDYEEARELAVQLELSEPVAIALVRRGYRTPEEARAFLAADESHPPQAFRSMGVVVERVLAAVEAGERITVHGDFDVDGVCAITILVNCLRGLGADCDWLIPDRMTDGYGLSEDNVRRLAERGTQLLITADCGITSVAEAKLAQELGMDVVVTDHHQAAGKLPDCPILHPALDGYPFEELCGTSVAWKLTLALREASGAGSPKHSSEAPAERFGDPAPDAYTDLDLVALATVADLVPLVGENRSLVKRGLEEVRRAKRPGIRALLEVAKCDPSQLDEGDLAFKLAPRINAAGRLYRADAGVELFLTDDGERAKEIAVELSRANGERRATERQVLQAAEAALRELSEELREAPAIVVAGRGWHPGVVGIVASRLVEKHHKPTVVVALDDEGGGRGSGRSIPGFDLLAGLEACKERLIGFGGHRAAAGIEIDASELDGFREAFTAHAAQALEPEDLVRTERIDAVVGGSSLGIDLAEELGQLAPFGMGNPGVRLLVPAARVRDVRSIGEGKHARFSLHSGSHRALGVAFGRSNLGVGEEDTVDATVRLEVNRWNGAIEPQVVLREVYPSPSGGETLEPAAWWTRFEEELSRDPAERPTLPEAGGYERLVLDTANAPAAVAGELASSGESVVAVAADAALRSAMARDGLRLTDYGELERTPGLCAGFAHVVLVDPPPGPEFETTLSRSDEAGGYLHRAWGEAERRFALAALGERFVQRPTLIPFFRDLRDMDHGGGEGLRRALMGSGPHPRCPEVAARCFRVLSELNLVAGRPAEGRGEMRVVSSGETDLERSASFRVFSSRYQEALRYLEGLRQP